MAAPSAVDMDIWSDALRVRGRLGALEVGHLRRAIQRVSLAGFDAIALDFRDVDHADFRALAPLFASVAECERRGARVSASFGSRHVLDLFRLAYPGVGEALLRSAPLAAPRVDDGECAAHAHG